MKQRYGTEEHVWINWSAPESKKFRAAKCAYAQLTAAMKNLRKLGLEEQARNVNVAAIAVWPIYQNTEVVREAHVYDRKIQKYVKCSRIKDRNEMIEEEN